MEVHVVEVYRNKNVRMHVVKMHVVWDLKKQVHVKLQHKYKHRPSFFTVLFQFLHFFHTV